jgi:hypothetical protein
MALTLVANYSKKVGLPNFSSHSFSVSCTKEIRSMDTVEEESTELYSILQNAVDSQLAKVGYMLETNGSAGPQSSANHLKTNQAHRNGAGSTWRCSEKQEALLKKLLCDHNLEEIAKQIADEMFGQPVSALNKLQASSLIKRLLEEYANNPRRNNGNGTLVAGGLQ